MFCSRVRGKLLSSQRRGMRWLWMAGRCPGFLSRLTAQRYHSLRRLVIHLSCLLLLNNAIIAFWRCLSLLCQVIGCRSLIVRWLKQAGRTLVDRYVTHPSYWSFFDRMRHLRIHRMDQYLLNGAFSNLFAGPYNRFLTERLGRL